MSVLIYKQRFKNPNYKSTASKNYAHIRYIATRPRVLKNETMQHGLFGKLKPGAIEEFDDWRDIARLVYKNSREHITMFRSIVSFDEKMARELMLTDQKSWQRYIENHIMTIAEKNHIRRENLQWVCAVHNEKKHPHIHVCFWDTSNRVKNPYTHPSIPKDIRRQMIKNTFAEKIRMYGEQKNLAVAGMRQLSDELVDNFDRHIRLVDKKRWEQLKEEVTLNHELEGVFDFEDKVLEKTAELIFQIKVSLPEKGRIAYQLLPAEVKAQVDGLVAYLLANVPALEQSKMDYINSKMQMVQLYGGSDEYLESMKTKFSKEADKVIANRVLGMVKSINRIEAERRSEERVKDRRLYFAEKMIMEAIEMLSMLTDTSDRQYHDLSKHHYSDLSKEARKELYLKHQDKGYEH